MCNTAISYIKTETCGIFILGEGFLIHWTFSLVHWGSVFWYGEICLCDTKQQVWQGIENNHLYKSKEELYF